MPAVAYAMSDLIPSADGRNAAGHIMRPTSAGGCGADHEVQVDRAGRAYIECDRCAPSLIAGHHGWASRPGDVPLTPDELGDQELAERDAKGAQNTLLKAMTDSFVKALQGGVGFTGIGEAPKAKSILEQIQDMSPEERAALASVLTPAPEPGPVEITPAEGETGGAHVLTPEPPKTARVPRSSSTSKSRPAR